MMIIIACWNLTNIDKTWCFILFSMRLRSKIKKMPGFGEFSGKIISFWYGGSVNFLQHHAQSLTVHEACTNCHDCYWLCTYIRIYIHVHTSINQVPRAPLSTIGSHHTGTGMRFIMFCMIILLIMQLIIGMVLSIA